MDINPLKGPAGVFDSIEQGFGGKAADIGAGNLGGGQRRFYNGGLRRAVEPGDHHLLGDGNAVALERSHEMQRKKVIGTDKGIRHHRHPTDLREQPIAVTVGGVVLRQNAEGLVHGNPGCFLRLAEADPPFIEAVAVGNIPYKPRMFGAGSQNVAGQSVCAGDVLHGNRIRLKRYSAGSEVSIYK